MKAPYDQIAGEYYADHHVTSRNFDSATREGLSTYEFAVSDSGLVVDVGCGRGRVGEFLKVDSDRIVQVDNSAEMLNLEARESCVLRVLHDAESLPFVDSQFSCVAAFLCDAFFGLNFLAEALRVTSTHGTLVATLPTPEWGLPLRTKLEINKGTTRFKTQTGVEVYAPSTLVPRERIAEMLFRVGWTCVNLHPLRLPESSVSISQDILAVAEIMNRAPIDIDLINLVIARKD